MSTSGLLRRGLPALVGVVVGQHELLPCVTTIVEGQHVSTHPVTEYSQSSDKHSCHNDTLFLSNYLNIND